MSEPCINAFGQPLGPPAGGAFPRPRPARAALSGRFCTLSPPEPKAEAAALHAAYGAPGGPEGWTYLPYGPFADAAALCAWMQASCLGDDPLFYTIRNGAGQPLGLISFLRIDPAHGSIEIGHVHLAPALRRSAAATEAVFLLMSHAFDTLGYARLEWKCDARNAASVAAALRLGFVPEGVFRKARVVKGHWRDTAWFAMTDEDWPARRAAFTAWLAPDNLDAAGRQRRPLAARQT